GLDDAIDIADAVLNAGGNDSRVDDREAGVDILIAIGIDKRFHRAVGHQDIASRSLKTTTVDAKEVSHIFHLDALAAQRWAAIASRVTSSLHVQRRARLRDQSYRRRGGVIARRTIAERFYRERALCNPQLFQLRR